MYLNDAGNTASDDRLQDAILSFLKSSDAGIREIAPDGWVDTPMSRASCERSSTIRNTSKRASTPTALAPLCRGSLMPVRKRSGSTSCSS